MLVLGVLLCPTKSEAIGMDKWNPTDRARLLSLNVASFPSGSSAALDFHCLTLRQVKSSGLNEF